MPLIEVAVPQGAFPGMSLSVGLPDGRIVEVSVPQGVAPGQTMQVRVPEQPRASMQLIEVAVPRGAFPGMSFSVGLPDGRIVEVSVPQGVAPGEKMQVRVPDAPPPKAPPASGQFGGALGGTVVEIALPTGALGIKMNSVVGARHAVITSVAPGSPCERLLGPGDQITALGGVLGDVDCAGMTPSAITSTLVAHKDTPGRLMHVIRAPATVVLASAGNCLYVDS